MVRMQPTATGPQVLQTDLVRQPTRDAAEILPDHPPGAEAEVHHAEDEDEDPHQHPDPGRGQDHMVTDETTEVTVVGAEDHLHTHQMRVHIEEVILSDATEIETTDG